MKATEIPNPSNWKITDNAKTTLDVTTRVVYEPTGNQIIYGFKKTIDINEKGNIINISGETRYNVYEDWQDFQDKIKDRL